MQSDRKPPKILWTKKWDNLAIAVYSILILADAGLWFMAVFQTRVLGGRWVYWALGILGIIVCFVFPGLMERWINWTDECLYSGGESIPTDGSKCLYADIADGGCALRATSDSPPPERVQYRELTMWNARMRATLNEIKDMDDTEIRTQARSLARSALNPYGDELV